MGVQYVDVSNNEKLSNSSCFVYHSYKM